MPPKKTQKSKMKRSFSDDERESIGDRLKLILKHGDLNLKDKDGDTPLTLALRNRLDHLAIDLIKGGADVSIQGQYGHNPLSLAIGRCGDLVIDTVIRAGANINACDGQSGAPLHVLFEPGKCQRQDLLDKFIELGADVNVQDSYGNTPLVWAAKSGDVLSLDKLLKNGANVYITNRDDNTAWDFSQPWMYDGTELAEDKARVRSSFEKHHGTLNRIAELIESSEIRHEPLVLERQRRGYFLRDATEFNEESIAITLALRLTDKEIKNKLASGELVNNEDIINEAKQALYKDIYLSQAKSVVHKAIEKYKEERLKERTYRDLYGLNTEKDIKGDSKKGASVKLDGKLLPPELGAQIGSFLKSGKLRDVRISFARKDDYFPKSKDIPELSPAPTPAPLDHSSAVAVAGGGEDPNSTHTEVRKKAQEIGKGLSNDELRRARVEKLDPEYGKKPAASPPSSPKGGRGC
jgi:hypothetical protein